MQVVTNTLLTHYEQQGDGKVVVLLHGWGDNATGLAALRSALATTYKVIALDLPGFGGTQVPSVDWGLTDYAAFVRDFLRKIGITDVYAYIGHSNGGAIIIRGVAEKVLSSDKVVLMGSAGIRNEYKGRMKALRFVAKTGKALAKVFPQRIQDKLRSGVYHTVGSDMLVAEHMQGTFKRIVTDDVRGDAPQLTMPVLLIYGENDDATPVGYGEQFKELMPDAELKVVPQSGHFVHLDSQATVHTAIQEFLR